MTNAPAIRVEAHELSCRIFTGRGPRCEPYVRLLTTVPEPESSDIPRPQRCEVREKPAEAVPVCAILASLGLTFGAR